MALQRLARAIQDGQLATVQPLLDANPSLVNRRLDGIEGCPPGWTPLLLAVKCAAERVSWGLFVACKSRNCMHIKPGSAG